MKIPYYGLGEKILFGVIMGVLGAIVLFMGFFVTSLITDWFLARL